MEDPLHNLIKYIRILEDSKDFKQQIKKITDTYKEDVKTKRKHSLHKDIQELMAYFCIPNKQDYHSYLIQSILDPDKFKNMLVIGIPASEEFNKTPFTFTFEEGGLILQLRQKLNRSDWEDLWHKYIESYMKKEEYFKVKNKTDYLKRQWEDVDLLLNMYKRILNGEKLKNLLDELNENKYQANTTGENKKYPSSEEGNIRKRIGKLKKVIQAL
ncbi:hypothetical protein ACFLZH_04500 [Patescibacteria group bacterium]